MAIIAFFCLPAYGHTNPTLEVVRELTKRNHQVVYFSFSPFQQRIEEAGARFINCDAELSMDKAGAMAANSDVGGSIKLLTDTTLALDKKICETLQALQPDCIVADSMAVWGKFAALKLGIPLISSTTTFAFNRYSAKIMKQSFGQLFSLIRSMPQIRRQIRRLREHGYPVKNLLSILQNDDQTCTIVYTSREFQPCAETFSDRIQFVGPSLRQISTEAADARTAVYISLGTVNNQPPDFFRNCVEALRDYPGEVIMAVGTENQAAELEAPAHFTIRPQVDQLEVLQKAALFLTHGGMNSVNEGLYAEVPLILYPQTAEQGGVTRRVVQLNAGILLEENSPAAIRRAVNQVLANPALKENAAAISRSFRQAGGAVRAAQLIEGWIQEKKN